MQVTYIRFGYSTVILKPIITLACISNKLKSYSFFFFNFAISHLGQRYLITFCMTLSIGYGVSIRS